jgi:hypothetical protein
MWSAAQNIANLIDHEACPANLIWHSFGIDAVCAKQTLRTQRAWCLLYRSPLVAMPTIGIVPGCRRGVPHMYRCYPILINGRVSNVNEPGRAQDNEKMIVITISNDLYCQSMMKSKARGGAYNVNARPGNRSATFVLDSVHRKVHSRSHFSDLP